MGAVSEIRLFSYNLLIENSPEPWMPKNDDDNDYNDNKLSHRKCITKELDLKK